MFEQSFEEVIGKGPRGWPVAASLTIQFSLVGAAMLVPLLHPEILPGAVWTAMPLASPPPPAPAPAAQPAASRVVKTVRGLMNGRLLLPPAIPRKVALIDDGDVAAVHAVLPGGVDGGIPGGVPSGVANSVMDPARVAPPPPPEPLEAPVARPIELIRLRTGGDVQDARIVHRVLPAYPPLARQAGIEGKVVFRAVISAQGLVRSLELVSGHPLLVHAAREAVAQWRYRPTLLNGEPCEVDTVIEVNFTLHR